MALRTFTSFISIVDIVLFIITLIVGAVKFGAAFDKNNKMAGPSSQVLRYMGGKYTPDIREDGEIWLLVTPIFLHAGFLHLLSNLFFQLRFGYTLEYRWTMRLFVAVYMVTGIGASLWSAILGWDSVSVGASGALFGILGADVAYLAMNWADIPSRGFEAFFLGFVLIINFVMGTTENIDNWAHFGGFVTGLLLAPAMLPQVSVHQHGKLIKWGFTGFILAYFLFLVLYMFLGKYGPWA